jgi:hypothetical protein
MNYLTFTARAGGCVCPASGRISLEHRGHVITGAIAYCILQDESPRTVLVAQRARPCYSGSHTDRLAQIVGRADYVEQQH